MSRPSLLPRRRQRVKSSSSSSSSRWSVKWRKVSSPRLERERKERPLLPLRSLQTRFRRSKRSRWRRASRRPKRMWRGLMSGRVLEPVKATTRRCRLYTAYRRLRGCSGHCYRGTHTFTASTRRCRRVSLSSRSLRPYTRSSSRGGRRSRTAQQRSKRHYTASGWLASTIR